MAHSPRLVALMVAALCGLDATETLAQSYERLSPFTEVTCRGDYATVRYDGRLYELVELDGLETKTILDFARANYGELWEKRFAEDLVEVLSRMGHPSGETVKLVLKDPQTGKSITVDKAPLTHDNRRAVWAARQKERQRPRRATPSVRIGPDEMRLALEAFQTALEERWSYLKPSGFDHRAAIADVKTRIEQNLSAKQFAFELQKVIARGIDGHAGVSSLEPPEGCLPFLIEPFGSRYVAFQADRSGFVETDYPFVETIDERPIDEWLETAGRFVPNGSPQYVRRHALRWLRHLQLVRIECGRKVTSTLTATFVSRDGRERRTLILPVSATMPVYGRWPQGETRRLDGNIGYLRIESMSGRSADDVRRWMREFRDTIGLVVDVRDNGGGSRDALRVLHSFLHAPGAAPRVANAAVYRLHPEHHEDHLASRFMHRENWPGWTDEHRRAIADFKQSFRPRWTPPAGHFSEWHYLILDRLGEPQEFHYDRPVVVLMNAKCFSATDIFLAGLKGLPQVTLLGEPSGGGSACSQSVELAPGGLSLRIGSMASFQPDGRLFDGHGIEPDVRVEPVADYFIGGRDNQLEAAVQHLMKQPHGR